MPLTEKDVRYVAALAHLELTEDEVRQFLPQLDAVLDHMQKLNQLDTSQVEPMAQVITPGAGAPPARLDQPRKTFSQEEALSNAPDTGAGCFRVPRVIERE
ncbi:MAG: Asp-tRNA(Asn)/Glu-tRNA(Gln) amidotransferase GatCAB subunit C [Acidobacteria bacterium]|nr:MAG: Asp-tRNA(Asn)/Glu-tRNA(Gln) amidotransferase GatCAB subunit C [Acidobacteriota bacterium]